MERQERVKISHRAKRLISRAFTLGVPSTDLRLEVERTIMLVRSTGRERLMRDDLKDLAQEVRLSLSDREDSKT